jgi:hypothetical protein
MDASPGSGEPDVRTITFSNGSHARMTMPDPGVSASSILTALGNPKPEALIMIFGGAGGLDESIGEKLEPLFTRGIARAAAKKGALIIDGGTDSGVMALMGKGVAAQRESLTLLGVAPSRKVTFPNDSRTTFGPDSVPLESNHSHFVLADGDEWGDETPTMFGLAEALGKDIPVVTMIINGDEVSKAEVLSSVRRGWPVIVVQGSGGLADEICRFLEKTGKRKEIRSDDGKLMEIVEEGDLHLFAMDCPAKDLELLIFRLVRTNGDQSLLAAWHRFAVYDANAGYRQKKSNRIQMWILILGALTTLLVLLQQQITGGENIIKTSEDATSTQNLLWVNRSFHYAIIVLPIIISILVAAASRFKEAHKWVLLRASAEAIKQQIYRFRTGTNKYRPEADPKVSPKESLAANIDQISSKLMKTDVNASSLKPYKGPLPPQMYGAAAADDGLSTLTPDQYIRIRLGDQLSFYESKSVKLETRHKRLHWLIYIFGGVGTFLAAVGIELWVAMTTSLAGVLSTFLEYKQVENTLVQYQQTATALRNVEDWWIALPDTKKREAENFDQLVEQSESILQTEMMGWVQHMEDAQATLRKERTANVQPTGDQHTSQ